MLFGFRINNIVNLLITTVFVTFLLLASYSVPVYAEEVLATGYKGSADEVMMWEKAGAFDYVSNTEQVYRAGVIPANYPEGVAVNGLDELQNVVYLPAIRNQLTYGTCWAFSGNSLVEINLAKKGLVNADDINLSESHTAYYSGHYSVDANNQFDGDDFAANSMLEVFNNGSNYSGYVAIVGDWKGLAPESINGGAVLDYSLQSIDSIVKNGLTSEYGYNYEFAHISGYQILKMPQPQTATYKGEADIVKSAIMEYGAVGVSYYADGKMNNSDYYIKDNAAYYCYNDEVPNHAVSIVGWDDDYSADNFVYSDEVSSYGSKPDGDGAWIVRNSWDTRYGHDGYFYISYYDKTIVESIAIAISAELASNDYDNIYQYDGGAYSASKTIYPGYKCANMFTAFSDNETLEAVSIEVASSNSSIAVDVYSDIADLSDPTSGQLVDSLVINAQKAGMYKVALSNQLLLSEGDYFSVVVYPRTNNSISILDDRAATTFFSWNGNVKAKANESYELYDDGWKDRSSNAYWKNNNFCIKAYTNNYSGVEVLPTGISFDKSEIVLYENLDNKNTAKIKPTVYPEDCTAKRLNWTSSNERVAVVDNTGKVTAIGRGQCDITATDKKGQNLSATCHVKVNKAVTQYTVDCDKKTIIKGQKLQLNTYKFPQDADIEYREEWYSSNEAVAKVNKGVVTAVGPGNARIYAKYGDLTASVLIEVYDELRNGIYPAKNGNYYLYKDNVICSEYNGLYYDERLGWWLINSGAVDFTYSELYGDANYGWWKISNGTIDFSFSDLYYSPNCGWWKINNGSVDFGYTDFYYSPTLGWWKINNGTIDFGFTDLYCSPTIGWWKVNNGAIDLGYTDLYCSPTYGWWKVNGGTLDLVYSDLYYSPTLGWWKVNNGALDLGYRDLYCSPTMGWWKVAGGALDLAYSGLYWSPTIGWWKVQSGYLDLGFTGICEDPNIGGWYVKNGAIDFTRNEPLIWNNKMCIIENGQVVASWYLSFDE